MQHPDKKVLLDMFSTMTKIRLFEGELQKFFAAGKIPRIFRAGHGTSVT